MARGKFRGGPKRGGGRSFTPQRILSGRADEADGAFRDREDTDSDEDSSSAEESGDEDEDEAAADPDNAALPESPYQATAGVRKSSPPPSSAQPTASALAPSTSTAKPSSSKPRGKGVSFGTSTSAPAPDAGSDDDADLRGSGPSNRDSGKAVKLKNLSVSQPMSRREREAADKKAAAARYAALHAAGKTDEAKSDLARLAKIRKEREAAAAATKAEKEEREKLKAAAAAASGRRSK